MKKMTGQKKSENILYAVLWTVLFAAPVLSMYVSAMTNHTATYDWQGVWNTWRMLGVFALAFYLHNLLVAPLLVYRGRKTLYLAFTVPLLIGFGIYQEVNNPHPLPPKENGMKMERTERTGETEQMEQMGQTRPPRPKEPPMFERDSRPEREPRPQRMQRENPPFVFGQKDTVAVTILLLLLALNVGAKYFFKSTDDRKRMKALERENLTHQLEYLKYQINPHFFMNTLNNIHALVDIDPEQAKHTIEVLSRLMRYMLYEANDTLSPLQKELDFISNYVGLMRIRYAEHVRITLSLPANVPDVQVPPLLFIIFVENAFKHGISYERESFVEIGVTTDGDGYVDFRCRNSRKPSSEETQGGVGLENVKERLQLIYGKAYRLDIRSTESEYRVRLRIPNKGLNTLLGR